MPPIDSVPSWWCHSGRSRRKYSIGVGFVASKPGAIPVCFFWVMGQSWAVWTPTRSAVAFC